MSERGKPSAGRRGQLSGHERKAFGLIVTVVRVEDDRAECIHLANTTVADGLRRVAEAIDACDDVWRIRSVSTPATILGDLAGRTPGAPTPEQTLLGQIGRMDLLEERPFRMAVAP